MFCPMENNNKKLTLFLRRAAAILIDTLFHDMLSREIILLILSRQIIVYNAFSSARKECQCQTLEII